MPETEFEILDHGYVQLIEVWGSDESIIEAARMSTNKGFNGWGTPEAPGDERLLRYLYINNHATPFEMAGMMIEAKAPIFVFREWHRHRTQSYNEMSARYVPLPDENYVPTVERLMMAPTMKSKQAGGAGELSKASAIAFRESLQEGYAWAEEFYQASLANGVPRELARAHLPVGRYSRMRASANLRNWLAFLTLREAPNAQWEIRQYAHAVSRLVRAFYPRTWELYVERGDA